MSGVDTNIQSMTRTEYRAVCPAGHSSEWHEDKSLAKEWRDGHNGAPLSPDRHREPCPEGKRATIEERTVRTDSEQHNST